MFYLNTSQYCHKVQLTIVIAQGQGLEIISDNDTKDDRQNESSIKNKRLTNKLWNNKKKERYDDRGRDNQILKERTDKCLNRVAQIDDDELLN